MWKVMVWNVNMVDRQRKQFDPFFRSLGNCVSLHGHFYCLHHYKQLLKSKGIYENGLGPKTPTGSAGSSPSDGKLENRYSMSSINSQEVGTYEEMRAQSSKMSVVWPPQADPKRKTFQIEEEIQLTRPQWPPADASPASPALQHRKAVPRSVL